jgi:hypothetical protein
MCSAVPAQNLSTGLQFARERQRTLFTVKNYGPFVSLGCKFT